MIGGGPIMEDEGNLTVQNPSERQLLLFQKKIGAFWSVFEKVKENGVLIVF